MSAALLVSAWLVREGARKPILIGIVITLLDAYFFLDESHAGNALVMLFAKGVWIWIMIQSYRAGEIVAAHRQRTAAPGAS
jgi:hypothetical protein